MMEMWFVLPETCVTHFGSERAYLLKMSIVSFWVAIAVAAPITGRMADSMGRKKTLIVFSAVAAIGSGIVTVSGKGGPGLCGYPITPLVDD